jgi:hypothetical protein
VAPSAGCAAGSLVPLWLHDTETSANAEQTLSYDRTFIAPDTVTEWPAAQDRLVRAVDAGMPGEFPAAFAALAVDATEGLAQIRAAHERTPDSGPGWYLVCRPARPAPPIELEQRISGARLVADTDLVGKELSELRAIEGELDIDDPLGDVYAEAITLLEWQLRRAAKKAGAIRDLGNDYVPVADDGLLPYSAPWDGPVVDAWRKTLTPVEDLAAVLRLRRVRRLARNRTDQIHQGYRDSEGRYVLVISLGHAHDWSLAEWPASLQVTEHWTDKTVLAGDDERGTTTTLLALTPTEDGRMRVDPVPLPPRSDRDAFAYGYGGGTPATHLPGAAALRAQRRPRRPTGQQPGRPPEPGRHPSQPTVGSDLHHQGTAPAVLAAGEALGTRGQKTRLVQPRYHLMTLPGLDTGVVPVCHRGNTGRVVTRPPCPRWRPGGSSRAPSSAAPRTSWPTRWSASTTRSGWPPRACPAPNWPRCWASTAGKCTSADARSPQPVCVTPVGHRDPLLPVRQHGTGEVRRGGLGYVIACRELRAVMPFCSPGGHSEQFDEFN